MSLKAYEPFILGGVASCVSEAITFPIDVTKTRIQIENKYQLKYRSVFNCFKVMLKEEGLSAFYNGLSPALLRQASYGTLKLGFYQKLKHKLSNNSEEKLLTNIVAGMISGASSMAICNPTDVVKIRFQSNQVEYRNKNVFTSLVHIYQNEGFKGLYRGMFTNAQYTAIVTAAELASYDSTKQFLIKKLNFDDNTGAHLTSSAIAGVCGTLASTPFDVVKSRMMSQRVSLTSQSASYYKNSLDCFQKTIKNEGVLVLYKSVIPSYLRLGPWNIIFFITYEKCKIFFPDVDVN